MAAEFLKVIFFTQNTSIQTQQRLPDEMTEEQVKLDPDEAGSSSQKHSEASKFLARLNTPLKASIYISLFFFEESTIAIQ